LVTVAQAIVLANERCRSGRLAEAEALCRWVLSREPDHTEAISVAGVIAWQTRRFDLAIAHFRRLIDLRPDMAEPRNLLANALRSKGMLHEAISAYRDAVRLKSDFTQAHYNLGMALREAGCVEEAIEAFRRAVALNPDFIDAANDLGSALREAGRLEEAVSVLADVVGQAPDFFKARNNLGNALRAIGRFDEAEAAVRTALNQLPDMPEIHVNLGNVLREKGDLDGAIAATRKAIELRPQMADAHQNLGSHLLLAGRYEEAWPEHEWRWRCQGMPPARAALLRPQWDGSNLDGQTILLHSDAGLGDAIHSLRYVPMVADRGGKIVVECQKELHCLVRRLKGVSDVVTAADALPPFDVQCALMSLPGAFGTTLQTIPSEFPYISVDRSLVESWAQRLSQSRRPRVGLVWAGNPKNTVDLRRSIRLSMFTPLSESREIEFHSLQLGEASRQASDLSGSSRIVDHSSELTDFAQTAALVENLDLVISVDTSVAHLAGALGKPIWIMIPFVPDWRWMLTREDSPWYRTMRIFRQPRPGEWSEVVHRVAHELAKFRTAQVRG
jgi:tetratricopeptide (TPR) repeat protein